MVPASHHGGGAKRTVRMMPDALDWWSHLKPGRRIRFQTCCARCGEWIDAMFVHAGEGLCRACFAAVLVLEEQQSEPHSPPPSDEQPLDEGV